MATEAPTAPTDITPAAVKGKPSDLLKKYAVDTTDPVVLEKKTAESKAKDGQRFEPQKNPGAEPTGEVIPAATPEDEKNGKAGKVREPNAFIKGKITEAENAKKAAEEAQKAKEKYETETIPALQTELESLKAQLKEGGTFTERKQLQDQIEGVKKELETKAKELDELKGEFYFQNIEKDPLYIKEFVQPMNELYGEAVSLLNKAPTEVAELHKALMANSAALNAQDEQERLKQEQLRDEILGSIYDRLDSMKRDDFRSTVRDFIRKARLQAKALADREGLKKHVEQKRKQINEQQLEANKKMWTKAFKSQLDAVNEHSKIPDYLGTIMAANNILVNDAADKSIAEDLIFGGSKYSAADVSKVLAQGIAYNTQVAHIAALNAKIAEQEETIKKMQGSTTTGSGRPNPAKVETEKKPETLRGFLTAKYGAGSNR